MQRQLDDLGVEGHDLRICRRAPVGVSRASIEREKIHAAARVDAEAATLVENAATVIVRRPAAEMYAERGIQLAQGGRLSEQARRGKRIADRVGVEVDEYSL